MKNILLSLNFSAAFTPEMTTTSFFEYSFLNFEIQYFVCVF